VRWSPDGTYLLFTTGEFDDARTWEIARYDLDTRQTTLLTNNDRKDFSPSFGPDGQQILYLTEGDGYGAIAEMDADGGNQHVVYDGPGYESSASFSPNGQYIAFTTDVTGRDEIYLMTPDGQNIDRLTENGGHYATWLPQ
jgi:TolB protein